MTITAPTYTARILRTWAGGVDIPVSIREDSGRLTLDSARAPHVEGSVTLSVADAGLLEDLDPRDNRRLEITAGGRVFDLGIREASPDRGGATVAVQLASDEAILGDFAQLADDKGPRAHQTSLRGVVDYVLDSINAELEPGAEDADVTAFWEVTNLLANPSAEINAANWIAGSGSSAVQRIVMTAPVAPAGTAAVRFTAAASEANLIPLSTSAANQLAIKPGAWYVWTFYIASSTPRPAQAAIQWWSSNGTVLSSQVFGTQVTTASSEFRRVTVIAQAPAGASHAFPYVRTTTNAVGNLHFVDCAMFYEGDELINYFDPSMTIPGYELEWQAEPHASTSSRIPDVERPPAALTWRAGDSALAFLAPLVQASGFRLVCNERREWTLRSAEYRAPGVQTFRYGINILTADEKLSRSSDEWFDGAVYSYVWTDDDGIEQTRIDSFALTPTPSKVVRREIRAPFPGPGRASYAVRRAQGRGRTVTATKQADWTEAAEQQFSALLDGTPIQVGIANSVQFDLKSNEVTTTSRTTDTPAGALDLLPGTINALTGTINNL